MNEQLVHPEGSPEKFSAKEHDQKQPEQDNENKETAEQQPDVQKLHQEAAEKAVSAKEFSLGEEHKTAEQQSPLLAQKELRDDAYSRMLKKARRQLNPVDRIVSKVTHQPVVDALSEFGGKTIARPSGILGGGLCALLGSSALLYISKHYGLTYNFSVFLLLFAGGFIAGLLIELLLRLTRR